jgi:hypothetical protein
MKKALFCVHCGWGVWIDDECATCGKTDSYRLFLRKRQDVELLLFKLGLKSTKTMYQFLGVGI